MFGLGKTTYFLTGSSSRKHEWHVEKKYCCFIDVTLKQKNDVCWMIPFSKCCCKMENYGLGKTYWICELKVIWKRWHLGKSACFYIAVKLWLLFLHRYQSIQMDLVEIKYWYDHYVMAYKIIVVHGKLSFTFHLKHYSFWPPADGNPCKWSSDCIALAVLLCSVYEYTVICKGFSMQFEKCSIFSHITKVSNTAGSQEI